MAFIPPNSATYEPFLAQGLESGLDAIYKTMMAKRKAQMDQETELQKMALLKAMKGANGTPATPAAGGVPGVGGEEVTLIEKGLPFMMGA